MTRPQPYILQRLRDPETRKTTYKPVMVVRRNRVREDKVSEAEKLFQGS